MIEIRDMVKRFGDQLVLDKVNFSIKSGESVAIIGRSGAGKSVLLKHIVGLLSPDEGEVLIDGQNHAIMSERALLPIRSRVGMVF